MKTRKFPFFIGSASAVSHRTVCMRVLVKLQKKARADQTLAKLGHLGGDRRSAIVASTRVTALVRRRRRARARVVAFRTRARGRRCGGRRVASGRETLRGHDVGVHARARISLPRGATARAYLRLCA